MKRRLLFTLVALALFVALGMVWLRQREYQRESYGGKHTRDWAWQLVSSQVAGSESNRTEAIAALQALGPRALPPLLQMLQERDTFYDAAVVKVARNLPINQRHVLLRQLRPGQAVALRIAAISALSVLGTNAAIAVPELIRAMQDPIAQIRWDAARTLLLVGDTGLAALAASATDPNAAIRHAAIFALGEVRTNAPLVVPILFNALLDPDGNVRSSAIYAVGRLGQNAVPMLMERLASTNAEAQVAALRALAAVRPPLRLIATNLIAIAAQSTGELRRLSIETMGALRLSQSNAVDLIIAALDDADIAMRVTAIKAVGEVSWKTTAVLPRVEEFTRSANEAEREAAAISLGLFGKRASNAVPGLQGLLEDGSPRVRIAATNALRQIALSP